MKGTWGVRVRAWRALPPRLSGDDLVKGPTLGCLRVPLCFPPRRAAPRPPRRCAPRRARPRRACFYGRRGASRRAAAVCTPRTATGRSKGGRASGARGERRASGRSRARPSPRAAAKARPHSAPLPTPTPFRGARAARLLRGGGGLGHCARRFRGQRARGAPGRFRDDKKAYLTRGEEEEGGDGRGAHVHACGRQLRQPLPLPP